MAERFAGEPLAARIAREAHARSLDDLRLEVMDKTKLCLFDLIGRAFESRALPWSRQAVSLAQVLQNGASITGASITGASITGTSIVASEGDAAFANAVMATVWCARTCIPAASANARNIDRAKKY